MFWKTKKDAALLEAARKVREEALAAAYEMGYMDGDEGTPLKRGAALGIKPELVGPLPDEETVGI